MLSHETYEHIIQDALDALPEQIQAQLTNVAIVIEAKAPPQQKGILLGLFEGIPITAWGKGRGPQLPDKITLFTQSIESVAKSAAEIPAIVRETLWHEIAHYFGFDHDHIHYMEARWRAQRSA